MDRRQLIVGSAAVLAASTIPAVASEPVIKFIDIGEVKTAPYLDLVLDAIEKIRADGFVMGTEAGTRFDLKVKITPDAHYWLEPSQIHNTWTGADEKWGPYKRGFTLFIKDEGLTLEMRMNDPSPTPAYDAANVKYPLTEYRDREVYVSRPWIDYKTATQFPDKIKHDFDGIIMAIKDYSLQVRESCC